MTDTEGATKAIQFLNSLNQQTAIKLLAWVETIRGPVNIDVSKIKPGDVSTMVRLNQSIPGGDGQRWQKWATCRKLPKADGDTQRHRRIQINLSASEGSPKTPKKLTAQGSQLKRLIPEAWEELKSACSVTTAGDRSSVKFWVHHIACVANGGVSSASLIVCHIFHVHRYLGR